MRNQSGNLFLRDDTFFGVCEGLGEDLGIPSNLFRMTFALLFFYSPAAAVGGYAGLGLLVLLTRIVAPNPRPIARQAAQAEPVAPASDNEDSPEREPMQIAA